MSDRPWLCPQDDTCPAPRHDDWQGYRRGCPSGKAHESLRLYRKRRRVGTATDLRGVPAIGTRRRLQALAAMGWSWLDLANRLGVEQAYPRHLATGRQSPETVFRSTAEKVSALYDELAGIPGGTKRAVTTARRNGWVSWAAWVNIDDPRETPHVGGKDRGADENVVEAVVAERLAWDQLTNSDQDHLVTVLLARDWTTAEIAERADTKPVAVRRVTDRMRKRERGAA